MDKDKNIIINARYTYNLKKIIQIISCINENIILINSLMTLSYCNDITEKMIGKILSLYKKLLKYIRCSKNYYFVKCFDSKFLDFKDKICKMVDKELDGCDYDVLYKIYQKQKEIFDILNRYKNRVEKI